MVRQHLDEQNKTLQLTFEVDILGSNAKAISAHINNILEDRKESKLDILILDLLVANRIDSMGLNLLVSLIRRAKLYNWRVKSRVSSETIYRTCKFTHLDRQMEIELVENS